MTNLDFKAINAAVLGSLGSLVQSWLPNGKVVGNEYLALNPTRADKNLGSFRVSLNTGKWIDFATGDAGGDVISLRAYITGISQTDAAKEIQNNNYASPKAPKLPKVGDSNNQFAAKIWSECGEIQNTLAQKYLQGRGITRPPLNIRFHPKLYHSPTKRHFPAMVAAVMRWGSDEVVAIHRTYLNAKTAKKADIDSNKMMLGSVAGGAVQLSTFCQPLVLAEGIETALSIIEATGMTCWAALSASNFRSLILPPPDIAEDIIIAADNDKAGITAANDAARKWRAEGRNVYITLPPQQGQDFNNLLMGTI